MMNYEKIEKVANDTIDYCVKVGAKSFDVFGNARAYGDACGHCVETYEMGYDGNIIFDKLVYEGLRKKEMIKEIAKKAMEENYKISEEEKQTLGVDGIIELCNLLFDMCKEKNGGK